MAVPYTFGTATAAIPLSQLDSNFATTITLGNTATQLGNTVTTLNNMTLVNTTISSGNVTVTNANVTSITATTDSYISGLTVGKGGGSISTNTAVGASVLATNSTGSEIVCSGYQALQANTSGYSLVALGYTALKANTTGTNQVAVGRNALLANTTGGYNTAVGDQALQANTTASNNTAVGYQAGYSNTTGTGITALGFQAGYTNTTASYSTFIGGYAGNVATANGNTCVGYQSGLALSTGTSNTYIGTGSGYLMTTGSKNTILGAYSGNQGGLDIRTSSNYIVLSDGDGNPRMYFNGAIGYIGFSGSGQIESYISTNCGRTNYYNDAGTTRGCQYFYYSGVEKGSITISSTATAYVTSSDYRLKNSVAPMTGALAKVSALKPCTYKWNSDGSDGQGFIAHELAEVVPQCVIGEKDAVDEDGNPKYQGIDTSFLVATLTAALQELKALVDAQAVEIAELKGAK